MDAKVTAALDPDMAAHRDVDDAVRLGCQPVEWTREDGWRSASAAVTVDNRRLAGREQRIRRDRRIALEVDLELQSIAHVRRPAMELPRKPILKFCVCI